MPHNYKGFDINDSTTAAPWGARETTWNENMIDTLVGSSIQGAMDTNGVKFANLYDVNGTTGISVVEGDTSVSKGLALGENQMLSFGVPGPGYPNAYIQYNSNQLELKGRGGLMFTNYNGDGTGGYLRVDDGAIVHDDGILTNGLHGFVSVDATAVRLGDSVEGTWPLEVKLPTGDVKFIDASGFGTSSGTPIAGAAGWIQVQVLVPECGYANMLIPLFNAVTQ